MAIKKKKKKVTTKQNKKLPVKKAITKKKKKVTAKQKKKLPVKKVVAKKKKKLPVKKVVAKKKKKSPAKKLSLKQKLLAEKKQILSKRRLTKADRSRIKVIDKALKKLRLAEKKETERIIKEEADKQTLAKAKRKKARILSTARRKARLSAKYIQVEPEKTPYIEPRLLPEPELPPEIPFYYIETGAAAMYSEPGTNDEEHYQYASNMNAASLDRMTIEGTSRVASVFERAFIGTLNKGPFEADEIHIYRHGIIIRPRLGEFTDSNRKTINNLLADYPGSSVHITREPGSDGSKDTFSIRINVGSSTESSNFSNTSENMDYHKEVFQSIYSYITDEFGDSEWSGFWDTEESMYE